VVHDLKNMLAGASGLTMLLLRKSDDDAFSSDLRKISERISNAGELATTLSRFILPAGRKGCGNDIGAIVERAIALTACPLRSSGMKTHARLDDELPQVHCGGEDLLFVFVSLFLTTARMMAGAGSSGSLTVSSGTADGHVQVRFSCEPVTISERELADLSGPAIPAWPQYGSYGFNLETAREVLHGMGGELRVSNDEAAVLTFTVELPSASSSEQRLRSVKKG